VEAVLQQLPISDQRAILGQLIIVANGQTQTARIKLAEHVIVRLREHFEQRSAEDLKVQTDLIIDHLRSFARLRSDQRRMFGKVLFSSLSELHSAVNNVATGNKQEQAPPPAEEKGIPSPQRVAV